jgi:hypothetical protein
MQVIASAKMRILTSLPVLALPVLAIIYHTFDVTVAATAWQCVVTSRDDFGVIACPVLSWRRESLRREAARTLPTS